MRASGSRREDIHGVEADRLTFVRPATPSERAAVGLPPESTPAIAARIIAQQRAAGLPAPEAKRPEWVRVTNAKCWPVTEGYTKHGDVLAVLRWRDDGAAFVKTAAADFDFVLCPDEFAPATPPPPAPAKAGGEGVTRPARAARFAAWYRAHVERDPGRYHIDANAWCAGNGDLVDAAQTAWLAYEAGFDDASLARAVRS